MAVKAEFQGDFRNFIAAIDAADVKLADFGKGAGSVETKLNRMVDNFSGRKVIQDATLMLDAFDRLREQGIELTDKELQRMGATASEAATKLRAMGQDVPDKMADLAKHAKTTNTGLESMTSTVKSLALSFGALFSLQAAASFVSGVIQSAGALQDLSAQTQIGVEDLQRLANAMSEFGVDADQLGKGLYGLGKRISGGDESVDAALREMGLSISELQGMHGEELFLKIEDGLATLSGSLRDDVSAQLFGDKLGAAMAGASGSIRDTLESQKDLNNVMSAESVAALDAYSEAIGRAQQGLTAIAANMIGPVAEGFNVLFAAAEKGIPKWDLWLAMLKDAAASTLPGVGQSTQYLATLLDHANQQTDANARATAAATVATTAWQGPLQQTAAAKKASAEATAELTKQDNLWLEGLKAADAEATAYAGVLRDQLKTAIDQTADADKRALAALTAKTDAVAATIISNGLLRNSQTETTTSVNDLTTAWGRMQAALATLEKQKKGDIDVTASQKKIYDEFLESELKAAQAVDAANAKIAETPKKMDDAAAATDRATKAAGVYMNQLTMLVTDPKLAAFFGTDAKGAVANTLYGGGGNGLTPEMAAAMAAGQFINTAGVGSVQRRAAGGPVNAGQPYLVGERGPEMFVPGRSGAIAPNGTGAPSIVINVTQPLGSPDAIARAVADALTQHGRATGIRL